MSHSGIYKIVDQLVDIFNQKQLLEYRALRQSPYSDLTVHELQVISAVGIGEMKHQSEIAEALNLTTGTVSVAISNLSNKGYLDRVRSQEDRRRIHIRLTGKGRIVYRLNRAFYTKMVEQVISVVDEEDSPVLRQALEALHTFIVQATETLD